MSSTNPIIFITGANKGLGLEIVKALLRSDTSYTIILGGRSVSTVAAAIEHLSKEIPTTISTLLAVQIDVISDDSIEAAYRETSSRYDRLDALINNAGVLLDPDLRSGAMSMRDVWNQSWNVNVTGAHIVTWTFAPLLIKAPRPARLLFLTSGTSSLHETEISAVLPVLTRAPNAGWPKTGLEQDLTAYRCGKTGLNMMMRQWERLLREDGIKVFAVSPGFLATDIGNMSEEDRERLRKLGAQPPQVGGEFIRDVIEGKRDGDAGRAIRKDAVQPW